MLKNKGIIINGQWLGNNVTTNELFNDLCSMAPFVMQDFIQYINEIEDLEEAVEIKKVDFPNNNTIEIEFSNSNYFGLVSLYYRLQDDKPKLIDKKISLSSSINKTEALHTQAEGECTEEREEQSNNEEISVSTSNESSLIENQEAINDDSIKDDVQEMQENELKEFQGDTSCNSETVETIIDNDLRETIATDKTTNTNNEVDNEGDLKNTIEQDVQDDVNVATKADEEKNYDTYDDCFANLYNFPPLNQNNCIMIEKNNNINAMLNEIMILKDELAKIKDIKPIWEKEESNNEIDDALADFRIMKDGTSHNASILDVDTFIAGNTLYRWGETLYLED